MGKFLRMVAAALNSALPKVMKTEDGYREVAPEDELFHLREPSQKPNKIAVKAVKVS